jgi:hypothetical protein
VAPCTVLLMKVISSSGPLDEMTTLVGLARKTEDAT